MIFSATKHARIARAYIADARAAGLTAEQRDGLLVAAGRHRALAMMAEQQKQARMAAKRAEQR